MTAPEQAGKISSPGAQKDDAAGRPGRPGNETTGTKRDPDRRIWRYPPRTPEQRLAWEVAFLGVILGAVGALGRLAVTDVRATIALTAIFGVNLAARFLLVNEPGDWAFFLFGVVGGGGNDLMSMVNGVYQYNSVTILPWLDGLMPAWMILFWGQVFLLFRKVFHVAWFRGAPFRKEGRLARGWVDERLVFDVILVVGLRAAIYATYAAAAWIAPAIYAIGVAIRLVAFPLRRNEWLIVAILPYAFCFEGLMVAFGLYTYVHPVFLGMPAWLFLWWVVLVPCLVKELCDRLEYGLARHRGDV